MNDGKPEESFCILFFLTIDGQNVFSVYPVYIQRYETTQSFLPSTFISLPESHSAFGWCIQWSPRVAMSRDGEDP